MKREAVDVADSRISVLNVIAIMVAIVFCLRLFDKQIVEGSKYKAKANLQHVSRSEIQASRGQIFISEEYDDPYPVSLNTYSYQLWVVPRSVKNHWELSKKLASVLDLKQQDIFDKINNKKLYIPPLKKRMSKDLADKIIKMDFVGVYVIPEEARYYSEGPMLGQVIGYMNAEGKGNYGIEAFYNEAMRGINGITVSSQDSRGRKIATIKNEIGVQNGADIILNIERNAQNKAEELIASALKDFDADEASMIVVDVKTGGILVMASNPSYDPNNFPIIAKENMELFRNPNISEVWEPGSIMKPLIVGIALDQGLITPETTETFSSCVKVQNYPICTAEKKAFGLETIPQVLQNSDNVAMVWIADKIGNETMFRYMKSLGFGEKSKIDLQGEVGGSFLDLGKWRDLNRATISFGQGISTTPLQMLMSYAAIANNGYLLKPHVAKEIRKGTGEVSEIKREEIRRVFKEQTARDLRQMLIDVVEKGTGRRAKVKGYWIGGKTGTAQIPKPEGGYYEDRHVGSFAGIFPADNPRFAMLVKVDNPKNTQWAESSAGPIFGQMAQWMLNYYRIAPNR